MVFHGTLGMVEEAMPDGVRVLWDITYRQDRREALDLAYAISVHKAQGWSSPSSPAAFWTGP